VYNLVHETRNLLQERHAYILQPPRPRHGATLAQELNVTEDTLRRDLRDPPPACARRSMAARCVCQTRPRAARWCSAWQQSDKSRLAAAAVTLIAPGSILFLDAGSSNLAIACALPEVPLTVLTNAPSIAAQLLEKPYRSHHDRWAYQAKPGGRSAAPHCVKWN
jgi:DeoR/GlpR family transcriptional regulator of sugar metabolism